MRTQNRPMIKLNTYRIGVIALLAGSLACSLGTSLSATPSNSVAPSYVMTEEVPSTQTNPEEVLSKSFPLPVDTTIDPKTISENDPASGLFTLRSTAGLSTLVDFYTTTLPNQAWTYRYTDANYLGGVTQFWKKDNLYLSLQFGYDNEGVVVKIRYDRLAADALGKLPKDFPIPGKAELTNTSTTTWDFTVNQDYAAVVAFYAKASSGWVQGTGFGYSQGDCGGDCGGPTYPPGASPMPFPTQDSRQVESYSWILPSQNQVDLSITPHGAGALLHISVTSLNASDSGLPAGISIYPGAKIQNATSGMVTFQAGASQDTVKKYYEDQLTAAGWTSNGQPFVSAGTILENWNMGNQTISITLSAVGANDCLVMIVVGG